ncbi:tRNA (guanosine(37)-N1)-methyltransferase TrmD [Patescibacteria group bacterium]|nr:tRNA (guanosine(37)-N1)-methyltransferase TrmD [Patescibacteria group bacterium]
MQFDIITIFPHIFDSYFNTSIIARAQKKRFIKIKVHDLRKWTTDKHKTVDDKPYGGGPGMILKLPPLYKAIKSLSKSKNINKKSRIILLSPKGKQFNQKIARRLSRTEKVILICGRYEGVDERVTKFVNEQISIGPYILTGGEIPAMIIVDAVARLIPGVIKAESLEEESFSFKSSINIVVSESNKSDSDSPQPSVERLDQIGKKQRRPSLFNKRGCPQGDSARSAYLEYPQYTRPEVFTYKDKFGKLKKLKAPKVLLSGDHQKVKEWKERYVL